MKEVDSWLIVSFFLCHGCNLGLGKLYISFALWWVIRRMLLQQPSPDLRAELRFKTFPRGCVGYINFMENDRVFLCKAAVHQKLCAFTSALRPSRHFVTFEPPLGEMFL
jgi:hypothetical protein